MQTLFPNGDGDQMEEEIEDHYGETSERYEQSYGQSD